LLAIDGQTVNWGANHENPGWPVCSNFLFADNYRPMYQKEMSVRQVL
jgi:hypothetical protein